MILGVLKDIKKGENRTICTPTEVASIIADGHRVLIEKNCGIGSGFSNEQYENVGAEIVNSGKEIYERCDMVTKVKEIEESEYVLLREGQIILTCLHPAGNPEEVEALLRRKVIAFTAEDMHRYGSPNCEAAGKQGALFGLESILSIHGGKGKFVSGLVGAPGINVLILGGGLVGKGVLSVLHPLGAHITIMDININVLRGIKEIYGNSIDARVCTKESICNLLPNIDIVYNCVKWPKERKDFLIDKKMLKLMEHGSVLVDISNDNPGAVESSRETEHDDPRYVVNGVIHFCVSNIPGAIAHSTTVSYAAEMLPSIKNILNNGVKEACIMDGYIRRSLTCYKGVLTHEETSAIQNRPWAKPETVLNILDRKLDIAPTATNTRSNNFIDFYKNK